MNYNDWMHIFYWNNYSFEGLISIPLLVADVAIVILELSPAFSIASLSSFECTSILKGGSALSGSEEMASDLRASASLYLDGIAEKDGTGLESVTFQM